MTICHCISHGCGSKQGIDVDCRTLKAHQRDDRSSIALEARSASKRAVAAQEDTISAFMASMTLNDNVSGPPKRPGSRLWARESPDAADVDGVTRIFTAASPPGPTTPMPASTGRHTEPSRKIAINTFIQRLSEIDMSADELGNTVSGALPRLEHPSGGADQPFPLRDLLTKCDSLLLDVESVKSKVHAVVELRRSVREKLDDIRNSILEAKRQWVRRRTRTGERTGHDGHGVQYNTGGSYQFMSRMHADNAVDHHFRSVLRGVDPLLQVSVFMVVACHIVLGVGR
jgi:hypothetical protein